MTALLGSAIAGLFADLAEGAAYAPDLAVVINQQIGRAGWMLVPVS
jgi:hypothetical protein